MWRDAAVFSAGLALSICVMLALDNGVGVVLGQVTTMPPVRNCEVGCSDGTREALFGIKNISICNGSWIGFVGGPTAQNLCASGWHVCTHEDINLTKQINYEEARYNISGCYSWAAAHDFGTCRPCSGNVHEEDMAGVGRDCGTQERVGQPSCITGGRVDICCSGYLTSRGCQFFPDRNTGVVCCADRPDDPCFNETCPNDCCGHGVCDNSYGTCTCDVGWSGDDCCTRCEALECIDCMNNTDICGWCNTSQSCTDLSAPACTDFLIGMPEICPERNFTTPENNTIVIEEEDEIVTISDKRGVVFGSVFGGVALILIILGCVAMYCIFSRDKYQEFWDAGALFSDKDVASNPLYKESVIFGENALYEERPNDNI